MNILCSLAHNAPTKLADTGAVSFRKGYKKARCAGSFTGGRSARGYFFLVEIKIRKSQRGWFVCDNCLSTRGFKRQSKLS